ncbi:MAG: hypothetical protein Q4G69_04870 [Planctomycetia bacterium]|nr:hypothetical protein [Planctomycetia bacterium]
MERRDFLGSAASAAALSLLPHSLFAENTSRRIRFESPFDGAVIHKRSGFPLKNVVYEGQTAKLLNIEIKGSFSPDPMLRLKLVDSKNPQKEIPITIAGNKFSATAPLTDLLTTLTASLVDSNGKTVDSAFTRIIWLKNSRRRFRFFIDDNIYCIRDIQTKKYKSLFDSVYMNNLRNFHRKYGIKVMLNMFYTTPDKDFTLSDFSDRYKSEWKENADWLRLAYHSRAEFPDRSLLTATRQGLNEEIELIEGEILRFAGKDSLAPPTCLHWGTIDRKLLSLFVQKGTKVFCNGVWPLSKPEFLDKYQVPRAASYYLSKNDAWYDFETGLLFASGEVCCNILENTPEKLVSLLKKASGEKNVAELLSIMTHEPYFWPFHKDYIPDHWDRLDACFRFVVENGYQPAFPQDEQFSALVDTLRKKKQGNELDRLPRN